MSVQERWALTEGIFSDLMEEVHALEFPKEQPTLDEVKDLLSQAREVANRSENLWCQLISLEGMMEGKREAFKEIDGMGVMELKAKIDEARGHNNDNEKLPFGYEPYVLKDQIQFITPGTAPCGEIGECLGGLTPQIVWRIAHGAGIKPDGRVIWKLASGEEVTARSFDIDGWRRIRDAAIRSGKIPSGVSYHAPERLIQRVYNGVTNDPVIKGE
jgi:hypothetical protein